MKESVIFFGNEKLATGISDVQPVIREAVVAAGFKLEKIITGSLDDLGIHESQLAVLIAYGRIIPQSILNQFPKGIINVHPSLLPIYRGPAPIEQAILDGVTKTGVTIMRLVAKLDEGPIYKQKTVPLAGQETKADLTTQLQKIGAELLVEVLPGIVDGTMKPRNQAHPDRAIYTTKLTKNDGIIDWTKSAEQIEREIRAYAGWPKSHTRLGEIDTIIIKANVVEVSGEPGQCKITDNKLVVFCGEKSLKIKQLQPAGKKEMTAQEFLRGYGQKL